MRKEDDIRTFTLPNGLRVVFHPGNSYISHAGLFVNAGSRNENPRKHGLAHFAEHTLFKGTSRRSSYHLLSGMENVGGEINAYTTKEETCIHSSFPSGFLSKGLDILSDIAINASFPVKEIEKEKDVVTEEIRYYRDNPDDLIFDEFESQLFGSHPLGHAVLGTEKSVASIGRKDLLSYRKKYFMAENMVLALSAKTEEASLMKLCERFFSDIPSGFKAEKQSPPPRLRPSVITGQRHVSQAHSISGVRTFGYRHRQKYIMALLNNILGGPANNSRLNYELREKRGLCYHIESHFQAYSDSGIWMVYTGTDPAMHDRADELVRRELKKISELPLGTLQLHRAKQQLCGQILISLETPLSIMMSAGKGMLSYGCVKPVYEVLSAIESVTAHQLLELARFLFCDEKIFSLTYIPEHDQ